MLLLKKFFLGVLQATDDDRSVLAGRKSSSGGLRRAAPSMARELAGVKLLLSIFSSGIWSLLLCVSENLVKLMAMNLPF